MKPHPAAHPASPFCLSIKPLAAAARLASGIGTLVCLSMGQAYAQNRFFDPSTATMQRIQGDAQARSRVGQNVQLNSLKFEDNQRTGKIAFDFAAARTPFPGTVVLHDQTAQNCLLTDYTQHMAVTKGFQQSESFSVTDTIGGSTTVEVSFDSPIASASVSQRFDYSQATTSGNAIAREQSWTSSVDVPVPMGRRTRVQFQVETREYRDVPWSADLVVEGKVDLGLSDDYQVCVFEDAGLKGARKCWSTKTRLEVPELWRVSYDTAARQISNFGPFGVMGTISSLRTLGSGKVTFWRDPGFGGWTWSQENTKDFPNLSVGWGGANPDNRFNAMLIEPALTRKQVSIQDILPSVAQRSFKLTGTYRGVSGVEGFWVATDDGPARCGLIQPAPSASSRVLSNPSFKGDSLSLTDNDLSKATPIRGSVLLRTPAKR